jgi:hypothetical protein
MGDVRQPCCSVLRLMSGPSSSRVAARALRSLFAALLLALPSGVLAGELKVLDLEPLEDLVANGHLHLPVEPSGVAALSIDLGGLAPKSTYVLCLDAETAEVAASAKLGSLSLPGFQPGMFWETQGVKKGFWDFARVETDEQGRFARAFELPLPPLDYRVRLLVKRVEPHGGMSSVLQSPVLLLEVQSPLRRQAWVIALVVALACPLPLLWFLRARRRNAPVDTFALSDTREEAPAIAGPAPSAAPAVAAPAVGQPVLQPVVPQPEPPRTRVEQARVEGVLLHHRNLSWIEIHGRRKSFRPRQALVFQILMDCDPDCEGMLQEEIVKAWEKVYGVARANPVRVRDIFRAYKDEPGDFIVRVPGPASAYRLRLERAAAPVVAEPDDLPGEHTAQDERDLAEAAEA